MANNRDFSAYARFHLKFMGYNFFDKKKRVLVPKYILWSSHREICLMMLEEDKLSIRFELKDRIHWNRGNRTRDYDSF